MRFFFTITETFGFCQSFLLLDEVDPQHQGLPVAEKKDCLVTIQDLTCYWDMASFLFFWIAYWMIVLS